MNRAERRRRGHRGPLPKEAIDPGAGYETVAGWCSGLETVEEAKKETHDTLIRLAGARRVGGVKWSITSGEKANETLGKLREGAAGELADHYRRLDGHLREYGGFLVVAMAEAVKPGERTPTFWNGEPTPARRVRVRVGHPMAPTWWCADLEGTERDAVEVRYGEHRFYLDDEDGSGWRKVTIGHGSPNWGNRGLPDDSVVVAER